MAKYFYDAYSAINSRNELGDTIKYLLWKYPEYKVWVTGTSVYFMLALSIVFRTFSRRGLSADSCRRTRRSK